MATKKKNTRKTTTKKSASSKPTPIKKKYRNIMQIEEAQYPYEDKHASLGKHRAKSKRIHAELGKYSLTEKQAKVLDFISDHIKTLGFPPTVRQIATYFNVSAKAAHDHVRAIAKKGYLRLFPGAARGIELVRPSNSEEPPTPGGGGSPVREILESTVMIPLVGSIAAGAPILAEENIESQLSFPKSMLPVSGEFFALRVKGDSMEEAGIFDGDIAVLKQVRDVNSEVKNGDIVAALIDGDATLKTYSKKKNRVELIPENKRYKPIALTPASNAAIIGVLSGVYRKY